MDICYTRQKIEYDESGVSGIHSGGYYGVVRDGMGSVVALYGESIKNILPVIIKSKM